MPIEQLKISIIEQVNKTENADLLDFILKLLFTQGPN